MAPDETSATLAGIRALSVRQPWAWAIAVGGKAVENRTRGTRYRGLLAIHASKNVYREDLDNPLILMAIAAHGFVIDEGPSSTGAVVAVAEVAGWPLLGRVHAARERHLPGVRAGCSPWAVRGQFHIELANVRPLPEPVPCRGMPGTVAPP